MQFFTALRSRSGTMQEDIFKKIDFNYLINTFPIWLVNLDSLYSVLPLQKNLFDLVIIDEATQ